MSVTRIRSRRLAAVVLSVAVGAGAAPALADVTVGAAQAPEVSKHETIRAGEESPVRIMGTKVKKGTTLKKGTKLVHRTVRLDGADDTARFVLSCGKSYRHQGMGFPEDNTVAFNLVGKDVDYIGERAVRLRADAFTDETDAEGTIYALCARSR